MDYDVKDFGDVFCFDGGGVEPVERSVEEKVTCSVVAGSLECVELAVVSLAHPELACLLNIGSVINSPSVVK